MNLQFYVCFHKRIFPELYKMHETEKKYITYYGVKDKDKNIDGNVLYEYELPNYNPSLQRNNYNEATCIYHVYKNDLYKKYDYIGFCQYDMVFKKEIFKNIELKISNNSIFYLGFFGWAFLGGQTAIIKDYYNVPAGLKNYNAFFNTNYTIENLITNRMIKYNTFLIPKRMYEKMMPWLLQYFVDDIHTNNVCERGYTFNPGHMVEGLTAMFLALEICEGAKYEKIDLEHNHVYRI